MSNESGEREVYVRPFAGAGGSGFDVGTGRTLFTVRTRPSVRLDAYSYDVIHGQRFLFNTFVQESTSPALTLIVNWPAVVKK